VPKAVGARAAVALLVAGAAAAALLGLATAVAGRAGLVAAVRPAAEPATAPASAYLETQPSRPDEWWARVAPDARGLRLTLGGMLDVPASKDYRFAVKAPGRFRIRLDGRVVLDGTRVDEQEETSDPVAIAAGQHAIDIEYESTYERPTFQVKWDAVNPYRFEHIPSAAFAPTGVADRVWHARAWRTPLAVAAVAAWSALIVLALSRLVLRSIPLGEFTWTPALTRTMWALGVLFAIGLWWGWPGGFWAPDELEPGWVLDAVSRRFAGGWFDRYPPFHFQVLGVVYAPALLFAKLGWMSLDDAAVRALLFLLGRLLSLLMALGVVGGVAVIAHRVLGAASAWPSALAAGLMLPFVFYAKLANLEVPYLFWFVVSMLFLVEARASGRLAAVVGFGATAAFAVVTKDQAYALYVVPAALVAREMWRRRAIGRLGAGAGAGLAVFAASHNLAFNWRGFVDHVALITGPASEGYRVFPATPAGQLALARATLGELAWCVGLAAGVAVAIGAAVLWRHPAHRRVLIVAVAMAAIYYGVFIAPIGYVYDRFLLPLTLLASLPAGAGLRRLLDARRSTVWATVAGAAIVAGMAWRALSVDLLLVGDSRYAAERWLAREVAFGDLVGSLNQFGYLPRMERFEHRQLAPTMTEMRVVSPRFVVVNTEFLERSDADTAEARWHAWLRSTESPYEIAFRHKTRLAGSALAWHPRFRDRVEDPFSNVDKANPEIVIYRKRP
jgi:hypothetical protein